jgi:hypothetical protein
VHDGELVRRGSVTMSLKFAISSDLVSTGKSAGVQLFKSIARSQTMLA